MPYYKESQNLNSKNFNKLRMPLPACLLEQANLITFRQIYSVCTGCQFVLEFLLKPFFSHVQHYITWNQLTSANLLIFIIHYVNFILHIKAIPRTFSSHGDRAFYACALKLWNSLPADQRSCNSLDIFKKTLKTHLFKIAYDSA